MTAGQWKTLRAFGEYHQNPTRTIDDLYVDGVSITHGQSPWQHVWTFAAGVNKNSLDHLGCPCNHGNFTGTVTPFIGIDFFCDSGRISASDTGGYGSNLLWDGEGCGSNSECCSFNGQPWLYKQLSGPTTDDTELRDCVPWSWGGGGGEVSLVVVRIHVK